MMMEQQPPNHWGDGDDLPIFVMTIDTEADNQWDFGAPLATENVRCWQAFQDVCDAHGVKTTYLVTSEIVADAQARRLLSAWSSEGRAEIGAHAHAWTTPPFLDQPGLRRNDHAHAYLSELPADLVRAKLTTITEEITEAFGARPTSFRAGRFGFDQRCAEVLADLGYLVDTSVTPLTDWRTHPGLPGGAGGPDFRHHTAAPFTIAGTGRPGLLEIPMTVTVTYGLLRRSPGLLKAYGSFPMRPLRNRYLKRWLHPQPISLRPVPSVSVRDLIAAWRDCRRPGNGVGVMMVHSSELMPGASPYRGTPESVERLLADLASFFSHVRASGARMMTLSDAARTLRAAHTPAARAL